MKKKLALLLAAVMLITAALPMNLLAVTNPRLTTYTSNHGAGTVMPDTGNLVSGITGDLGPGNLRYNRWAAGTTANTAGTWLNSLNANTPYSEGTSTLYDTSSATGSIFANDGSGSYLVLEFPTGYNTSTLNKQESFTVTLDNAVWYMLSNGGTNLYNTGTWNTTYGSLLTSSGSLGQVNTWGTGSDLTAGMKNSMNTTGGTPTRAVAGSTTTSATDQIAAEPVTIVNEAVIAGLAAVRAHANAATGNWTAESAFAVYKAEADAIINGYTSFVSTADVFKRAEIADMKTTAYQIYEGVWAAIKGTAHTPYAVTPYSAITYNAGTNLLNLAAATMTGNVSGYIDNVFNFSRNATANTVTGTTGTYTFNVLGSTNAPQSTTNPSIISAEFLNAYNNIVSDEQLMTLIGLSAQYGVLPTYYNDNPYVAPFLVAPATGASFIQIYTDNDTPANQTVYCAAINGGSPQTTITAQVTKMLNDFTVVLRAIANGTTPGNTPPYNDNYLAIVNNAKAAAAAGYFDTFMAAMQTSYTTLTNTDAKMAALIVNGTDMTAVRGLELLRVDNGPAYIYEMYYRGGSTTAPIYNNNYAEAATKFARENNSYNSSTAIAIPYTMAIDTANATGVGAGRTATFTFDMNAIGTIQAGDMIIIPLVIKTLSASSDVTYTINSSTGAVSQTAATVISGQGNRTGITTNTFQTVANAAYGRIYLSDLVVTERSLGILTDGTIWVVPPKGYDALMVTQNFQIKATAGLFQTQETTKGTTSGTGWSASFSYPTFEYNNDGARQALGITINGFQSYASRSSIGTLRISGIALNPKSNDPDMIYNLDTDLTVQLYGLNRISSTSYNYAAGSTNWSGYADMGITKYGDGGYTGPYTVASRQAYSVNYTADAFVTDYSGKKNIEVATVTVAETTYNSWNAKQETSFTLVDAEGNPLDGVKFSAVGILSDYLYTVYNTKFSYSTYGTSSPGYIWYNDFVNLDKNEAYLTTPYEYSNVSFSREGGILRVTDLYTANTATSTTGYSSSDVLAKMMVAIELSAEPNFEGEVWLQIGGSALSSDTSVSNDMVKIAEFYPPVTVSTEVTEVQISYQKYNVADVVITENFDAVGASAFEAGKKVQIALGEYGQGRLTDYLYFTPVAKSDVSIVGDPNFTISEVTMVSLATQAYSGYNQRVIEFTVMRKSKTAGSEITLTNLEVNVNRSVPTGEYDLLVGGDSIVDNWVAPNSTYLYLYDRFDVFGVVVPGYIKVVTETINMQTQNTVTLKSGTNIIQVNGKDEEIPVPVLNVDGRMYVPIRFAAVALNVPDSNIIFDEGSRKVVITTAERIVTFQQDSPVYTINGVELSMNEGGVEAVTFIDPQTDRAYIPVRFLAYALNVSVDYDPETGEAILNAK